MFLIKIKSRTRLDFKNYMRIAVFKTVSDLKSIKKSKQQQIVH